MTVILWLGSALSVILFSAGIILCLIEPQLTVPFAVALSFTLIGVAGLFLSALTWILRPSSLMAWPFPTFTRRRFWKKSVIARYSAQSSEVDDLNTALNPNNAEVVMKSIRGIPYLIQAIQYSMEATYFKEQQGEVVRTSVIHTAPGCTSVLDCNSDHGDPIEVSITAPRSSGPDEQWESTGESTWRNQQLRLSLNRNDSSLLVFPYREVNTQPESFDHESLIDAESMNPPDEFSSQPRRSFETAPTNRGFEIRCIGMSDAFLHKFNSSFKR